MRRIRNVMLVILSVLLLNIQLVPVSVKAEDEVTLSFEFVMEDGNKIPDEIEQLLPEKKTYERESEIPLEGFKDCQIDDYLYVFDGWDKNDFTLKEDTLCIGTWSRKTVIEDKHLVKFDFVEQGQLDGGKLPDEVRKLVPEDTYIKQGEKIDLPSFGGIAGFVFLGWEAGAFYEDGSELYFGVWQKRKETKSIERPDRPADKAITSGGTPVGIPGSGAPHQQLDGEDAFCYEPDVTGYANKTHSYWKVSTLTGKAANIIGMGKLNKMPYGAIQAALWNYLKGGILYTYGNYEVDPNADVYSAKGLYDCSAAIYATYVTPAGAIQDLIMDGGCKIRTQTGTVKVKKEAAKTDIDYLSISPNNYSLKDAEYGVYSDKDCTKQVGTLTTKDDGTSNAVSLEPGTYYVKEKKASKGFRLDENVYTCEIAVNKTVTVNSIEDPISDIFKYRLYKENAYDNKDITGLDEAEFTLKYYDTQSDDISKLTPKYTWVFKPIVIDDRVEVLFDREHFVSGDELILIEDVLLMPLGVYTLEESKAPKGFIKDPNIYLIKVSEDNGAASINLESSGWITVKDLEIIQSEQPQTVSISIQKKDSETGENKPQGLATLQGAEFTVKKLNKNTNEKETVGKIVTDEKGYGTIQEDSNGKKLLPGTYYIKESMAPDGYTLSDEEFVVEAIFKEDNENAEFMIEVEDKVTQIKIMKVDSDGNQIASAELEIIDENGKVVHSFVSDGTPHIVKGLTLNHHYKLHEVSVDPGYMLAKDMDIIVKDDTLIEYVMIDHNMNIHTSARFKESDSKNYVADGIAHVIDTVSYEWLNVGKEYILKGELIDKGTKEDPKEVVISTVEKNFTPEECNGKVEVEFSFNFDGYENHDFVVYEELYEIKGDEEILIVEHKDYDDEDQTVHVKELYTAGMVLYKIGNGNYNNKLNGAYYDVKSSRTRKDGTKIEEDLGVHLTGGIYIEDDKTFKVTVYADEDMNNPVKTYESKYDNHFKKQAVSILDLKEGDYYVQINDEKQVKKYVIQKGAIVLENQIQDTNLTYTEVKAPTSYRIDKNSYTFSVGHDYSKNIVENYRSNTLKYIPITGVE